jgi:hypothetical protein
MELGALHLKVKQILKFDSSIDKSLIDGVLRNQLTSINGDKPTFDTLETTCQTTRCHNQRVHDRNLHLSSGSMSM